MKYTITREREVSKYERNLRSEDAAQQKSMHSQKGKKDATVDGQ